MSEDWLVTSDRSVQLTELLQALEPWGQSLMLRATDDESCTVVADAWDNAVAWVTPSVQVRDADEIAQAYDLSTLNTGHQWWTEVVCPAGLFGTPDPGITIAALAGNLAGSVGGEALRLSSAPTSQQGGRRAEPPMGQDIACDVLTDQVAVFVQSRRTLSLTAWTTLALAWAVQRGRVPVLLTPVESRLSPVLGHIARRGGCWWIRGGGEGMTDGFTGAPIGWDGSTFSRSGAPSRDVLESQDWQTVLECEAQHLTAESAPIGQLTAAVHAACGAGSMRSWGRVEPTGRAWDRAEIAAEAGEASPDVFRYLFRSATTQGLSSIVPEPIGVREEVLVNVGGTELLPMHTDLARLGERLLQAGSDVAIVSYQPVPAESSVTATGPRGDTPGLIAYRPGRFEGPSPRALNLHLVPGVEVVSSESGVVLCFYSSLAPTESDNTDRLAAWWRCLRALAEADGLRGEYVGRTPSLDLAASSSGSG